MVTSGAGDGKDRSPRMRNGEWQARLGKGVFSDLLAGALRQLQYQGIIFVGSGLSSKVEHGREAHLGKGRFRTSLRARSDS